MTTINCIALGIIAMIAFYLVDKLRSRQTDIARRHFEKTLAYNEKVIWNCGVVLRDGEFYGYIVDVLKWEDMSGGINGH